MIKEAQKLTDRALSTIHTFQTLKKADISIFWDGVISNLYFFIAGTEYVCELAQRRMINDEQIANPGMSRPCSLLSLTSPIVQAFVRRC